MLKRAPEEGRPASTHTLCQKQDAFLVALVPSFQPATLQGEEGVEQGKHSKEQDNKVDTKR